MRKFDANGDGVISMEEFYNKNYLLYEVNSIKPFYKKNIWNIAYDKTDDYIYMFVATIK